MKSKKLIYAIVLLAVSTFTLQSCIGSFSLTNKVLTWNRNVNNKFVNELVFFAFWVLPVYEVTAAADLLVINSIEFWSGNNPLEANNKIIKTEDGNYQIYADETGYKILTPEGKTMNFIFDKNSQIWSFSWEGKESNPVMKFIDETHIQMLDKSGNFVDVETSSEGLRQYSDLLLMPMMALE